MAKFPGVRAKGNGIEIRWEVKKRKYSLYIDEAPTETGLANAARYRKSLITATKTGEYNPTADNTPISFEQCCRSMLQHKAKTKTIKPSTLRSYRSKLEVYWSSLARLNMRDIKLQHLREIDRETNWSHQKTRNNAISALKQVFKFAMDEDIIDTDPSIKLRPGRFQKKAIDAFSRDEQEAILRELPDKYRLFYLFMLDSGLRTGEVCGLRWSDIKGDIAHVERSIYKGEVTSTKTHQAREALLSPRTVSLLKQFQPERFKSDWLFTSSNKQPDKPDYYTSERSLTIQFKLACERADVRYRRPYYCRHTYATNALLAGVNAITVAKQIGDRLETMQRNYADVINAQTDRDELAKAHNWEFTGNKSEEKI